MMKSTFSTLRRNFAVFAACLVASCATGYVPMPAQADLTAIGQPFAARLQAQNVSRIESPQSGGGFVKVMTSLGPFDIRSRDGAAPTPFVVSIGTQGLVVSSSDYTPAQLSQYREALNWTLSQVLRVAPANEADLKRLQDDSGGGRGGR